MSGGLFAHVFTGEINLDLLGFTRSVPMCSLYPMKESVSTKGGEQSVGYGDHPAVMRPTSTLLKVRSWLKATPPTCGGCIAALTQRRSDRGQSEHARDRANSTCSLARQL